MVGKRVMWCCGGLAGFSGLSCSASRLGWELRFVGVLWSCVCGVVVFVGALDVGLVALAYLFV